MSSQQQHDDDNANEYSESQDGAAGPTGSAAGADDLNSALGNGDDSFVIPTEKKPVNRTSVVFFGIVLAAAAGYYFMYVRTGPSSASAAAKKEVADADKTITQFLKAGDQNVKAMEQMLRNTEKEVEKFKAYPSIKQVPLSELKTNPFVHMPAAAKLTEDEGAASAKRKAEEKAAALQQVQQLELQSIMHSDKAKACMIGNVLYQEGQKVGAFTIEKISPNAILVRNGAYRFELRLQK